MTNKNENNPERYAPKEAVEEALKMQKELGKKEKEEKLELKPEQEKIYDQFLTKYKDTIEIIAGKTVEIKGERYRVPEKNMNRFVIVGRGEGGIDMAIGGPGEHATLFRKLLGKREEEKGLRGAFGAGEVIIYSSPIKKEFREDIITALEASLGKFNKDVEIKRKDVTPGERATFEALEKWRREHRGGD